MKRIVLLTFAFTMFTASAFAQDDPRKAKGEALYKEAAALHDAGKESEALAKWREAYGVYPTPNILFSIAREEQLLGQNVAAIRDYRAALKDPLLNLSFHDVAQQRIAELEKQTARIDVTAPPGAAVTLDGAAVDASAPLDAAPGAHTVECTLSGKKASQQVDAPVGQVTKVTLTIEASSVEPPRTETTSVAFPPPTGAIILGGAGIVGLGLGVGFGVASQSKKSDFDNENCAVIGSAHCSDLHDSVGSSAAVSWVGYIAGGALLAGGVVWWLVAPRKETTSVSISPITGHGVGGLQLRGSF